MHLTGEYLLKNLPEACHDRRWVVGLSGGLDSTVLLHLCVALREQGEIQSVVAIHVNHGLSANAVVWQAFCESMCQRWSVSLVAGKVAIDAEAGKGLEASARAARYRFFEDFLEVGDYLLQAHHRNDQAETLLYRMMRGCGVHGLAAIPKARALGEAVILRPLLEVAREDIHAYAQSHGIEWVEDESNLDVNYDRNFLRHAVLPQLSRRWPGALNHLGCLAADAADVAALLDQVAETDLQQVVCGTPRRFLPDDQSLEIDRIGELSAYRQRNLLRYWLRRQGFSIPSRVVVQQVLDELVKAAQKACPLVAWKGCEVRRHAGHIIAISSMGELPTFSDQFDCLKPGSIHLPGNGRIIIEEGHTDPKGVWVQRGLAHILLGYRDEIAVSPFRMMGRQGRKSLKKWLNTLGVPPWIRGRLPIFHRAGELVAIPGLLVNEDYVVALHEQSLRLRWQQPFGRE